MSCRAALRPGSALTLLLLTGLAALWILRRGQRIRPTVRGAAVLLSFHGARLSMMRAAIITGCGGSSVAVGARP